VKHFITLFDITAEELQDLLRQAAAMKCEIQSTVGNIAPRLAGRTLGMLFEKPSLRTRVSFEAAMIQLGGASIFLGAEAGWGKRESVADFAKTLTRYVDALVFRGNDHAMVEAFSRYACCPTINGLTPLAHPCQALADIFTMQECFPQLNDVKVVFIGDGNNVARSLAVACAMMRASFVLAGPRQHRFPNNFLANLASHFPQVEIELTDDPKMAVKDAHIVYTDVWASMGDEDQQEQRKKDFQPYRVDEDLMRHALPEAKFMHCLPARRGEEVTDAVMDGHQSIVFQQAENRLHAQKAILMHLLQ
jgi:ornithine carbamoyltransferase